MFALSVGSQERERERETYGQTHKMSENCTAEANERRLIALGGEEDEEPANLIWLGIATGLAASVCINLGQNLESYNSVPPGGRPDGRVGSKFWKNFGTGLFVVAACANFAAFSFAPASLLSPLEGAQFVSNLVFNLWIVNPDLIDVNKRGFFGRFKNLFWRVLAGTMLVIVGIVLPVLASSSEVPRFDHQSIECFWGGTTWLILLGSSAAVAIFCLVLEMCVRPANPDPYSRVDQLIYAVSSCIIGGFAVCNAKAISELVELLFGGDSDVLTTYIFWVTLVMVGLGFAGWIYRLTRSVRKFNPLGIVPLLQGLYIVCSAVGSGVFMEEFNSFDEHSTLLYGIGMSCLVAGLFLILPPGRAESPSTKGVGFGVTQEITFLGAGFVPIVRGYRVRMEDQLIVHKSSYYDHGGNAASKRGSVLPLVPLRASV